MLWAYAEQRGGKEGDDFTAASTWVGGIEAILTVVDIGVDACYSGDDDFDEAAAFVGMALSEGAQRRLSSTTSPASPG